MSSSWWTNPDAQKDREAFKRAMTVHLPDMARPTEGDMRRAEVNAQIEAQWAAKWRRKGGDDE